MEKLDPFLSITFPPKGTPFPPSFSTALLPSLSQLQLKMGMLFSSFSSPLKTLDFCFYHWEYQSWIWRCKVFFCQYLFECDPLPLLSWNICSCDGFSATFHEVCDVTCLVLISLSLCAAVFSVVASDVPFHYSTKSLLSCVYSVISPV